MKNKLTIGLILLTAASCGCDKLVQSAAPPTVPVRVSTVEHVPVGQTTSYSASITPNEQIDLTFKSGGCDVLASAEQVLDYIISTYTEPNLTPEQIHLHGCRAGRPITRVQRHRSP